MLYRPLFWTAFWCEDWLSESSFRSGATNFLVSSASSKTAFCLAYLIGKRFKGNLSGKQANIVGLTSRRNVAFTKNLGIYGQIVDYDSLSTYLTSLRDSTTSWVYVDVAGNEDINTRIRSFFASSPSPKLSAQISLGLTNLNPATTSDTSTWTQNTNLLQATTQPSHIDSTRLPDPEPFFMPEWLVLRKKQLSVAQITTMQLEAWRDLMRDCRAWVQLERVYGGDAVLEAYAQVAKSGVAPDKGLIWSMWDSQEEYQNATRTEAISPKL